MDLYSSYMKRLYSTHLGLTKGAQAAKTKLSQLGPVIDDDVARMLQVLLYLARPMNILEVGTSIGYSTSTMALVLKEYGGTITTVEYDPEVARQAVENFHDLDVDDVVEIIVGDARNVLPAFKQEFDMVFQDANKRLYPQLFEECVRLLKPGGFLVAEDTLFPVMNLESQWHSMVSPIAEFNQMVADHPRLSSTILPIGEGLTIAVKKG